MMSCGLLTSSKEPGWDGENITQEVPRVLQGELPYTLSRSAMLQSPHGIDHVLSNCPLTPLSYTARNLTTAQVCRWPRPPPRDRELELLVYYTELPKPSAVLEAGLPGAEPGSLMGDPAVMMTLLPRVPEVVPAQSQPGSSSSCWAAPAARPAPWTAETCPASASTAPRDGQAGGCARWARGAVPGEQPRLAGPVGLTLHLSVCPQETLVLLLKSLPLGCYFNTCGFGSEFESFYPQSVENTQQTKAESLQRLQLLQANLGGTEILEPLRAVYRSPCRDGPQLLAPPGDSPTPQAESPAPPNPELQASDHSDSPQLLRFKPLFVFTDGEVENTQEIIAEDPQVLLLRHRGWGLHGSDQRHCSGSRGQRRVHHRPGPCAAQGAAVSEVGPAAGGDWDLTELGSAPWDPGGAAALGPRGDLCWAAVPCLRPAPRAAPDALSRREKLSCRRSTVCTGAPRHSHGGHQPAVPHPGPDLEGDAAVLPAATGWRQRLPVHRLAAKSLLLELEGAVGAGWEGDGRRALKASLSSGVVCSITAYVGVDMGRGQLVRWDVPLAGDRLGLIDPICKRPASGVRLDEPNQRSVFGRLSRDLAAAPGTVGVSLAEAGVSAKCQRLVEPGPLAGCCAGGERDRRQGEDTQDVTPSIWATVLAMVRLHDWAVG
ncbi:unnamed protein product [Eretmochelys imbricata]